MPENKSGFVPNKSRKKINPEIFWLLAIFLLAVALRTAAAFSRGMVQFDETSYARIAENLLLVQNPLDITGTSATWYSILYPLTMDALKFSMNIVIPGYTVSILFGSLIILPTYLFGKLMWNQRVGVAAALLVAVLPVMVDKGSIVDGQSMFAFWLMCAILFGYRMQFTMRCKCGMLAGTSLGLAYLVNPSALYYLVVLFVLMIMVGLRQELNKVANKTAAQFLALFLIIAIPNIVYMTWENSSFTVDGRPQDQIYASIHGLKSETADRDRVMMGLDANGDLKLRDLQQGPGLMLTLIQEPVDFIKAALRNDYNFYVRGIQGVLPVWLLLLMGLGMFKDVWTRGETLRYGYLALVMAPLLVLPVTSGDLRLVVPYMGLVMLPVARGWVFLEDWGAETVRVITGREEISKRGKTRIKQVLAVIVLVPLVALSLWTVYRTGYPIELRQAGEWLADNGGKGSRIMSRESSTSWYADGTMVVLPYASVGEVIDYGQRNNADFLVLQRRMVEQLRPELEPLMDPAQAGPQLTPVYHERIGTDSEVIIYQIMP